MQTKQILALAATLFTTTALAAPTADSILPEMVERQETSSPSPYFLTPIGARDVTPAALEERSSSIDKRGITIVLFGGDGCRGEQHAIVQDSGSFCYAVPAAKRSIHGVGKYAFLSLSLSLSLYLYPPRHLLPTLRNSLFPEDCIKQQKQKNRKMCNNVI